MIRPTLRASLFLSAFLLVQAAFLTSLALMDGYEAGSAIGYRTLLTLELLRDTAARADLPGMRRLIGWPELLFLVASWSAAVVYLASLRHPASSIRLSMFLAQPIVVYPGLLGLWGLPFDVLFFVFGGQNGEWPRGRFLADEHV